MLVGSGAGLVLELRGCLGVSRDWVFKASGADEHIHQGVFGALLTLPALRSKIGREALKGELWCSRWAVT